MRRQRERLDRAVAALRRESAAAVEADRARFGTAARRLAGSGTGAVRSLGRDLPETRRRLARAARTAQATLRAQAEGIAARLRALDYRKTLERGYSLVWGEADELVRSARSLGAGERIRVRFHEGEVAAEVKDGGEK